MQNGSYGCSDLLAEPLITVNYICPLIKSQWKHLHNITLFHTTGFKSVVKGYNTVNVSLIFVFLDCQANRAYLYSIFVMRTRQEGNTWLTLLKILCQFPQHGKTSTWYTKSLHIATEYLVIILIPLKVVIWKICNSTCGLKPLPS